MLELLDMGSDAGGCPETASALASVDKPGRLSDAVIIMAVEIRHTMLESLRSDCGGPGFLRGHTWQSLGYSSDLSITGGHNITIVSRSYMVLAGRWA